MPKVQTAPTKPERYNPMEYALFTAPPLNNRKAAAGTFKVSTPLRQPLPVPADTMVQVGREQPLSHVLETVERTFCEWKQASQVVKDLKIRRDAARTALEESSKACRAPVTELEKALAEAMTADDLIAQVEDKNDNKEAYKRVLSELKDAEVHAEIKRYEYMDAFAVKGRLVAREAALRNKDHHSGKCTFACGRPNAKPFPDTDNCSVCFAYVTAVPSDVYTTSSSGVVETGILII